MGNSDRKGKGKSRGKSKGSKGKGENGPSQSREKNDTADKDDNADVQGGRGAGVPRARGGGAAGAGAQGGPASVSADDTDNRRFFDRMVKTDDQFRSDRDGAKFLTAALAFKDKLELLFKLTNKKEFGELRLRRALATDDKIPFLKKCVTPFMDVLFSDELSRGLCKKPVTSLIRVMYETPGFVERLMEVVQERQGSGDGSGDDFFRECISDDEELTIGYFVLKCCSEFQECRSNPGDPVRKFAQWMIDKNRKVARQLRTVLGIDLPGNDGTSTNVRENLEDLRHKVGGRHDNDKENFRDIELMPTVAELMSEKPPYLPIDAESEAGLLGRQFRLLREDMVGPARTELKCLRAGAGDRRNVFDEVAIEKVELRDNKNQFNKKNCVVVSFALQKGHRTRGMRKHKDRMDYWDNNSKGMLPIDALVCLAPSRDPYSEEHEYNEDVNHDDYEDGDYCAKHDNSDIRPELFASVVMRESSMLAGKKHDFIWVKRATKKQMEADWDYHLRQEIGLVFTGAEDVMVKVLSEIERGARWKMIQVSTNFFSYRPILKCLQDMDSVVLANLILPPPNTSSRKATELYADSGPIPDYLKDVDIEAEVDAKAGKLNASQQEAMRQALISSVGLIQGPPGTGKTYVGAEICEVIYKQTKEIMIVQCYTNHALDQFLEHLLEKGIAEIARIGGRSKSKKLEQFNVRELVNASTSQRPQAYRRRVWQLREREDVLLSSMKKLREKCQRIKILPSFADKITNWSWNSETPDGLKSVKAYLEENFPQYIAELDTEPIDSLGFKVMGPNGKPIPSDYNWKRWISGEWYPFDPSWTGAKKSKKQSAKKKKKKSQTADKKELITTAPQPPPTEQEPITSQKTIKLTLRGFDGSLGLDLQNTEGGDCRIITAVKSDVARRAGICVDDKIARINYKDVENSIEDLITKLREIPKETNNLELHVIRKIISAQSSTGAEEPKKDSGGQPENDDSTYEYDGDLFRIEDGYLLFIPEFEEAALESIGPFVGSVLENFQQLCQEVGRCFTIRFSKQLDNQQRKACHQACENSCKCLRSQSEGKKTDKVGKGTRYLQVWFDESCYDYRKRTDWEFSQLSIGEQYSQFVRRLNRRCAGEETDSDDESVEDGRDHSNAPGLFALNYSQRKRKVEEWLFELLQNDRERLAENMVEAKQVADDLNALYKEPWEEVLKMARVIGCTTTGAAIHCDLLADVGAKVLIQEETGEILEAHTLSSFQKSVQHAILIGDHKQLRPKVENYELTVASGNGYDLNRSMFERLVLGGFPHVTLEVQHRMRPEISGLIKPTYPKLQDGSNVLNRPNLRGISGNVVFVDHRMPENSNDKWKAAHESKTNEHEAIFISHVVFYLLCQGYTSDQICIVTPYLGQLFLITKELKRRLKLGIVLGDKDIADARSAAGGAEATLDLDEMQSTSEPAEDGKNKKKNKPRTGATASAIDTRIAESLANINSQRLGSASVRVATIDNYQGEEADIIIGSLVRSNDNNSIGFLREPERVNVLLSRARLGMILCGNSHCLRNAKSPPGRKLWQGVLDMMEQNGQIFEGLPTKCVSHGIERVLCSESDFSKAPMGGCAQPCGAELPCGHRCPLPCHSIDHRDVRCRIPIFKYCDKGHGIRLPCSDAMLECSTCAEIADYQRKRQAEIEKLEEDEHKRMIEYDKQKAKEEEDIRALQKRLEHEEREFESRRAKERRDLEAKRLWHELELREKYRDDALDEEIRKAQEDLDKEMENREKEYAARSAKSAKKLEELERKRAQEKEEQKLLRAEYERKKNHAEQGAKEDRRRAEDASEKLKQLLGVLSVGLDKVIDGGDTKGLHAMLRTETVSDFKRIFPDSELPCILSKHAQATPGGRSSMNTVTSDPQWCQVSTLIRKKEWIKAHTVLEKLIEGQKSFGNRAPSVPEAEALLGFCELKLDCTIAASQKIGRQLQAMPKSCTSSLFWQLAKSLQHDVEGSAIGSFGWAFAVLLHPWIAGAPTADGWRTCLVEQAIELLSKHRKTVVDGASVKKSSDEGVNAESKAALEREKYKKKAGTSEALKELLHLTGMKRIKDRLFEMNDKIKLDEERGIDFKQQQFNIRFDGNPGTGKTTIARIYGKFLKEKKVLKEDTFVETSGSKLINGGTTELKKMLEEKLKDGGVLFIDEAYQLNPKSNPAGAQVLDYLLPEIENRRGELVTIIAGYRKQMDDLMSHNEGLPSRFPHHFTFEDYSDEELCIILKGVLKSAGGTFKIQNEKHLRIASRRLGNQRGAVGFGNARAARNLYEMALSRQASRVLAARDKGEAPDPLLLTREDVLGPREIDAATCPALKKLAEMRGLEKVKRSIENLRELVKTNVELEDQEKPLRNVSLNRVFIGSPGTGKTTVAAIYGEILKAYGLLSKGDVITRFPQDFVGTVLGESEKNTKAILDGAKGCVLVIDEAYGLNPSGTRGMSDPYKTGVIDTIVAEVQGVPGDDRCVLLLGYKDDMEDMIRNANPGLARRFQMQDAFEFEDYNDEDLLYIMMNRARQLEMKLDVSTAKKGIEILAQERRQPNFGNAGAVNNLLSRAVQKMETRLAGQSAQQRAEAPLIPSDFVTEEQEAAKAVNGQSLFADMVGCDAVKEKLKKLQDTIEFSTQRGRDPLDEIELNYFFAGAPGTGKTTVARKMGKMFASLGLLAKHNVVECSASDFVTGYANQASGKTRELFKSALGGVLFIDEAYRLHPQKGGPMMAEVLDEIVNILTEETFKNKMAVIFAGYPAELNSLLQVNPGLKSRISESLDFEDFSEKVCTDLLVQRLVKDKGLTLEDNLENQIPAWMAKLKKASHWSNGRDIETLAKRIFQELAGKAAGSSDSSSMAVTADLFESALNAFIKSKEGNGGSGTRTAPNLPITNVPPPMMSFSGPARRLDTSTKVQTKASPHPVAEETEAEICEEVATPANAFEDMPPQFLSDLTNLLVTNGVDISDTEAILDSVDKMGIAGLTEKVVSTRAADADQATDLLQKWLSKLKSVQEQKLKIEEEMRQKKLAKRPVWRCAVCGRSGCQVAPYIEGYVDVEMP